MIDPSANSTALEVTSKIMIAGVIIFFLVIIFIFLLHLYARFLRSTGPEDPQIVSWRRQLANQNRPSEQVARRQKGLNSSTLKSLPIVVYNPKEFKDRLECAICLSELQEMEKVRILPNCNHGFHLDCIDKWFSSHSTCPICRNLVVAAAAASTEAVPGSDSSPEQQEEVGVNAEMPPFPTNVLFWGDETQVRTSQELASERLVIDIPMASDSCSIRLHRLRRLGWVLRMKQNRRWLAG